MLQAGGRPECASLCPSPQKVPLQVGKGNISTDTDAEQLLLANILQFLPPAKHEGQSDSAGGVRPSRLVNTFLHR